MRILKTSSPLTSKTPRKPALWAAARTLAALLPFATGTAMAHPHPTTTDEARALAGAHLPAETPSRVAAVAKVAKSTDEARAIAGAYLPEAVDQTKNGPAMLATTTDEARALSGARSGRGRAAEETKRLAAKVSPAPER